MCFNLKFCLEIIHRLQPLCAVLVPQAMSEELVTAVSVGGLFFFCGVKMCKVRVCYDLDLFFLVNFYGLYHVFATYSALHFR